MQVLSSHWHKWNPQPFLLQILGEQSYPPIVPYWFPFFLSPIWPAISGGDWTEICIMHMPQFLDFLLNTLMMLLGTRFQLPCLFSISIVMSSQKGDRSPVAFTLWSQSQILHNKRQDFWEFWWGVNLQKGTASTTPVKMKQLVDPLSMLASAYVGKECVYRNTQWGIYHYIAVLVDLGQNKHNAHMWNILP